MHRRILLLSGRIKFTIKITFLTTGSFEAEHTGPGFAERWIHRAADLKGRENITHERTNDAGGRTQDDGGRYRLEGFVSSMRRWRHCSRQRPKDF